MRKLISILFKSRKERNINHILQKFVVKSKDECICEMKGVSGYCHKHKTDWL